MKKFIALTCALFMATAVFAQVNYGAAIRQAHTAVNQTESASQGSTQPMQPQPQQPASVPPAQGSQPMDPVLAATLHNIANLSADFDQLTANTPPAPAFTNDLATAANEAKASPTTVAKLAGDLQTILGGNEKLRPQHQKLAQNIHAVFNSSHLSATQQQAMATEVQKILLDAGVPAEQAAALDADIKAVEDETK